MSVEHQARPLWLLEQVMCRWRDIGMASKDDARARLAGISGGEFDLRRAVIEAEALNPKYI